jgi:hypothetical protein
MCNKLVCFRRQSLAKTLIFVTFVAKRSSLELPQFCSLIEQAQDKENSSGQNLKHFFFFLSVYLDA